ncbi:hypothetical protein M405DRAFT_519806 [Rhizopogon salebrosus TDB-379]|nr:hypothetical protein M405DRAFT_519806 [Rhizopogon salebrosus TDB-379]
MRSLRTSTSSSFSRAYCSSRSAIVVLIDTFRIIIILHALRFSFLYGLSFANVF